MNDYYLDERMAKYWSEMTIFETPSDLANHILYDHKAREGGDPIIKLVEQMMAKKDAADQFAETRRERVTPGRVYDSIDESSFLLLGRNTYGYRATLELDSYKTIFQDIFLRPNQRFKTLPRKWHNLLAIRDFFQCFMEHVECNQYNSENLGGYIIRDKREFALYNILYMLVKKTMKATPY